MMMEMNLIAETDRHKEAWLHILPKLWEFTRKIPNIIEQFQEDIDNLKGLTIWMKESRMWGFANSCHLSTKS